MLPAMTPNDIIGGALPVGALTGKPSKQAAPGRRCQVEECRGGDNGASTKLSVYTLELVCNACHLKGWRETNGKIHFHERPTPLVPIDTDPEQENDMSNATDIRSYTTREVKQILGLDAKGVKAAHDRGDIDLVRKGAPGRSALYGADSVDALAVLTVPTAGAEPIADPYPPASDEDNAAARAEGQTFVVDQQEEPESIDEDVEPDEGPADAPQPTEEERVARRNDLITRAATEYAKSIAAHVEASRLGGQLYEQYVKSLGLQRGLLASALEAKSILRELGVDLPDGDIAELPQLATEIDTEAYLIAKILELFQQANVNPDQVTRVLNYLGDRRDGEKTRELTSAFHRAVTKPPRTFPTFEEFSKFFEPLSEREAKRKAASDHVG